MSRGGYPRFHAKPPPALTPSGGHQKTRLASGRYASYWNAFLFVQVQVLSNKAVCFFAVRYGTIHKAICFTSLTGTIHVKPKKIPLTMNGERPLDTTIGIVSKSC